MPLTEEKTKNFVVISAGQHLPINKTQIRINLCATDLLDEGFKFSYFTNEYKTKTGKVYRFCYEHGYLQLENNLFALVFRKEYVE